MGTAPGAYPSAAAYLAAHDLSTDITPSPGGGGIA
jgi:hypothetical protein